MLMHLCGFGRTISRNTVSSHCECAFEITMRFHDVINHCKEGNRCLRQIFAAYGSPDLIISDNGPQFISDATFIKISKYPHIGQFFGFLL